MGGTTPNIGPARPDDLDRIFEVWESSVRATHHFLGEDDMQFLIPLVKQGLPAFGPIHVLRAGDGQVYAFVGAHGTRVDMLFVHADWRGRGAGRTLMEFAIRELGAREVDVNEQNPAAVGFYRHLGFSIVGRSSIDAVGQPFPILHMALDTDAGAPNPWLRIPLDDYEAHMSLPSVAQAQLLSDIFADALRDTNPHSVAVPGCAGGNGFERVAGSPVERVVGIDVNPAYVEAARARYGAKLPNLQLFVADIQSAQFECEPVDLVFAGLLFEYVDPGAAMRGIQRLLRPGATLVTVVQLAGDTPEVTPSPYHALRALQPVMRLIEPDALRAAAATCGLHQHAARTRSTPAGKQLHVQVFRLSNKQERLT